MAVGNEQLSGLTASVNLIGDKALVSTKFGFPNEREQLRRKIDLLVKLRELTLGVAGLIVPNVLERNDQRAEYIIERAKGINLTEQQGESQGDTKVFFAIPLQQKIQALITYFKMIGTVNGAGFAFHDHKNDSVFLQPDGTITIVDADGMAKVQNPWNYDMLERNGIQDIIFGLFSRGLDKNKTQVEMEYLVPGGVLAICSHLENAESGFIVANRIEGWLHDKYDPSIDYPYHTNSMFMKKELIIPGMTNAQYDIADAQSYLDNALASTPMQDYLRFKTRH